MWYVIRDDELYHHGIKGQKWGVRRFQNEDGSLTAAGRKHWGVGKPEKSNVEKKNAERKSSAHKSIDKTALKKAAVIGATVTAATAVGVLASRTYGKETKALEGFLKQYGDTVVHEEGAFSNKINQFEKKVRQEDIGFKEASRMATEMRSQTDRNIVAAREQLRASSKGAKKLSDKSIDTLATKQHFSGALKPTDYLDAFAKQGKESVQKFLKAA